MALSPQALERKRAWNREYMRERLRQQTPEEKAARREYNRSYRAAHPDKVGVWNRRNRLKTKYGLTPEGLSALLESQDGLCLVCLAEPATHIDHNHETGLFRGLLCENCNRGLGMFHDDPDVLVAAAEYLVRKEEPWPPF